MVQYFNKKNFFVKVFYLRHVHDIFVFGKFS